MKKSKGIVIFIVFLIVVAAVALFAYAYLKTDVFLTSEQKFVKYLLYNYKNVSEMNIEPYGEFINRMRKETSVNETVVKMKITEEGITEGTDGVVTVKTSLDPVAKKEQIDVKAKKSNIDVFDMQVALTDTRYGIRIPDLHEKYIALKTDKGLKKFATNLNVSEEVVDVIPDSINLFPSIEPLSEELKTKYNELLKKHGKRLLELVKEQSTFLEAVENIDLEDVNAMECNKYSISLTMKQFSTIYTTFTTELFDDKEVENLLLQYIPNLKMTDLKAKNEEIINEFSLLNQEDIFDISVYESEGVTRKTTISLSSAGKCEFYIINSDLASKIVMIVDSLANEMVEVGKIEHIIITNEVQNEISNLTFETNVKYKEDDIKSLKAKYAQDEEISYMNDESYYDEVYKDVNSKVSLRTNKIDNNTLKSTVTLSGAGYEEAEDLKISSTLKLNETIKFDNMTEDNSIFINEYTSMDYMALGVELISNAANTAKEKPNSGIGGLYNSFSTVLGLPSVNDTEEQDAVQKEIEDAINNILLAYRFASKGSEDESIADYLTIDNIQSKCSPDLKIEFHDGETLKCTKNDNVYFVKFVINGTSFMLEETEIYYSEDGTYEGIQKDNSSDVSMDMSGFSTTDFTNTTTDTTDSFDSIFE